MTKSKDTQEDSLNPNQRFAPVYSFSDLKGLENLVRTFSWETDIQAYNFEEAHSHTYHEILIFITGGGKHIMGDQSFENRSNSFHILPSGFVHQNQRSPESDGFTIVFSSHYLDQLQLFNPQVSFSRLINNPQMVELSTLEFGELSPYLVDIQKKDINNAELLNLVALLLIRLVQRLPEENETQGDPLFSYQLLQFVNAHFKQKQNTAFYANAFNLSISSFTKRVKNAFGKSVLDIQNEKLLSKSKQMLIQGIWTVQEIGDALHFSDESHFCRFFKKEVGLTPKEFTVGGIVP
ncbi:MAG: AraC family transcriptional activator of pobA [Sphingobacteriales bacterium]|jgi:AraC family transcriptional activator of pobA